MASRSSRSVSIGAYGGEAGDPSPEPGRAPYVGLRATSPRERCLSGPLDPAGVTASAVPGVPVRVHVRRWVVVPSSRAVTRHEVHERVVIVAAHVLMPVDDLSRDHALAR